MNGPKRGFLRPRDAVPMLADWAINNAETRLGTVLLTMSKKINGISLMYCLFVNKDDAMAKLRKFRTGEDFVK